MVGVSKEVEKALAAYRPDESGALVWYSRELGRDPCQIPEERRGNRHHVVASELAAHVTTWALRVGRASRLTRRRFRRPRGREFSGGSDRVGQGRAHGCGCSRRAQLLSQGLSRGRNDRRTERR